MIIHTATVRCRNWKAFYRKLGLVWFAIKYVKYYFKYNVWRTIERSCEANEKKIKKMFYCITE